VTIKSAQFRTIIQSIREFKTQLFTAFYLFLRINIFHVDILVIKIFFSLPIQRTHRNETQLTWRADWCWIMDVENQR